MKRNEGVVVVMPKQTQRRRAAKPKSIWQGRKAQKVRREFKAHKLHSGSNKGPIVTNPKQMAAIAASEQRRAKKK